MPTISFTVSSGEAARVSAAYGARLGLGRDATLAEVKTAIVKEVIAVVAQFETVITSPTHIGPT